jgi:hypothetical protein
VFGLDAQMPVASCHLHALLRIVVNRSTAGFLASGVIGSSAHLLLSAWPDLTAARFTTNTPYHRTHFHTHILRTLTRSPTITSTITLTETPLSASLSPSPSPSSSASLHLRF